MLRDEKALHRLLEEAMVEIWEAADKMWVLGLNHPGGAYAKDGSLTQIHLDEDKQLMLKLSSRFELAAKRISKELDQ